MKSTQSEEQDALFELFDELQYNYSYNDISKNLTDEIDDFIIDKIKDALKENNNNQTRASDCLGIKRTTLIAMCKRLQIF
jgi:transcriptional regulator with GAF, ATPase, and Fis domain